MACSATGNVADMGIGGGTGGAMEDGGMGMRGGGMAAEGIGAYRPGAEFGFAKIRARLSAVRAEALSRFYYV